MLKHNQTDDMFTHRAKMQIHSQTDDIFTNKEQKSMEAATLFVERIERNSKIPNDSRGSFGVTFQRKD